MLLVVTTGVSLVEPRRVVSGLVYLTARPEEEPEGQEAGVAPRLLSRRHGIRAITQVGVGVVHRRWLAPQLALASEGHTWAGGSYRWGQG